MKWRAYAVVFYGILILAGGLIGHIKANSLPSLLMGSGSALLILACGWAMFKNNINGLKGSIALSTLLFFFFTYRYILTGKMMPAGLMATISLIMLILLYSELKKLTCCREK